jgi:hypothetical protein
MVFVERDKISESQSLKHFETIITLILQEGSILSTSTVRCPRYVLLCHCEMKNQNITSTTALS